MNDGLSSNPIAICLLIVDDRWEYHVGDQTSLPSDNQNISKVINKKSLMWPLLVLMWPLFVCRCQYGFVKGGSPPKKELHIPTLDESTANSHLVEWKWPMAPKAAQVKRLDLTTTYPYLTAKWFRLRQFGLDMKRPHVSKTQCWVL